MKGKKIKNKINIYYRAQQKKQNQKKNLLPSASKNKKQNTNLLPSAAKNKKQNHSSSGVTGSNEPTQAPEDLNSESEAPEDNHLDSSTIESDSADESQADGGSQLDKIIGTENAEQTEDCENWKMKLGQQVLVRRSDATPNWQNYNGDILVRRGRDDWQDWQEAKLVGRRSDEWQVQFKDDGLKKWVKEYKVFKNVRPHVYHVSSADYRKDEEHGSDGKKMRFTDKFGQFKKSMFRKEDNRTLDKPGWLCKLAVRPGDILWVLG